MLKPSFTFATLEEVLGPAEKRFLGGAYRDVERSLSELTVYTGPDGKIRARAKAMVTDPRTRSEGAVPHLDSMDVAVFGVELAESAMAWGLQLGPAERRAAHLDHIEIWSGTRPHRQLAGVLAEMVLTAHPDVSGSTVLGHVGPMRFRLSISHLPGHRCDRAEHFASSADLLGDPLKRYYAGGFRRATHDVRDIRIDTVDRTLTATVAVIQAPDRTFEGLAADFRPEFTPLDGLIVLAQLTKVLIVVVDGVPALSGETMWLRRMSGRIDTTGVTGPAAARLATVQSRQVQAAGIALQEDRMTFHILGASGEYGFVHQLGSSVRQK